jgi:hypothetical protein
MTMVIENQNRQFGGLGYDNAYQNNIQPSPQFSDPWSGHTTSHPSSAIYPGAMAAHPVALSHGSKREDTLRPSAISMPYSTIPVSAPSMVPSSTYPAAGYGGSELLVMPPELPRTTFEQAQSYTTASPMSAFTATTYAPLDYAQSLHHQQQQQQQQQQPDGRSIPQQSVPTLPFI